ncbi:hypothetical protein E2320_022694 [Naja naja]|nr:hypothetical protein E2320_022694 [Naja naja]
MLNRKRLVTCAVRPIGIYEENHLLMEEFYERGLVTKKYMIWAIPASVEHGRVCVGKQRGLDASAQKIQEEPSAIGGQVYFCYDDSPYKSYEDFNMEFLRPCSFRLLGSRPLLPFFLLHLIALVNAVLQWLLNPFCVYAPILNPYTLVITSTTFTVKTDKALQHFRHKPCFTWEESRNRTIRWLQEVAAEKQVEK